MAAIVGKYVKPGRWIEASGGEIPENAVEGGEDSGETLYVGRAEHEGAMIPGKVHGSHGVCYVAWNGEEHAKEDYHVLTNPKCCDLGWVPASGGVVPSGALQGGYTQDGEALYVARAEHEGSMVLGKLHSSHGVCYVAWGGEEHGKDDYEVLTVKTVWLKLN